MNGLRRFNGGRGHAAELRLFSRATGAIWTIEPADGNQSQLSNQPLEPAEPR